MTTPFFPAWSAPFTAQVRRVRTLTGSSLHPFEALFGSWIERHRLAQQEDGAHSRNRRWNLRLVFWSFLWQVAQAGASCREAIRQARSLCLVQGQPIPPPTVSPYCQARAALPLDRLAEIHDALVAEAEAGVATRDLWCGHRVRVVDGTTVTLPDTPANQQAYPQQSVQKPGCGFPILRLVALFDMATGMIRAWTRGPWRRHELTIFQQLWQHLCPGDVLLGDRGFCTWGLLAQCTLRGVHAVFRARGLCRTDGRRGRRIGPGQRLVVWRKPRARPTTITRREWKRLPETLPVRLVRCRIERRGFRTRQVTLATTLLDPHAYPPEALSELYYRRWQMELSLRSLKTTLQMDQLSCKAPSTVLREVHLHLLAHNLIRRLMLEAARRSKVPLVRLSFAGALATARRYAEALLQARTLRLRLRLRNELLDSIARDPVPDRPGRREPRAVKRRPKPYPRLMCHRHRFREIQHQNRYYIPRAQRAKHRGLN
jgi:hypothetical protein